MKITFKSKLKMPQSGRLEYTKAPIEPIKEWLKQKLNISGEQLLENMAKRIQYKIQNSKSII